MITRSYSTIKLKVIDEIQNDISLVTSLELPSFIEIQSFNPLDDVFKLKPKQIESKFQLPEKNNQVIYIFSLETKLSSSEFAMFINDLERVKKIDNDGHTQITTAKRKHPYADWNESSCLYVGTSKSLASRLQQHIGYGSKDTATIMLRKWGGVLDGSFQIRYGYYNFGKSISSDLVKRIEFHISVLLKPLIGHNRKA